MEPRDRSQQSLQERYRPQHHAFACGPANPKGLHIRSFPEGERVVAEWNPEPHHEAFAGVLNGGIVGTLFDCHSNWTAAWHLMTRDGLDHPPSTVTAEFHVRLLRPTPSREPVRLVARVAESRGSRGGGDAELLGGGEVCATWLWTFTAV